jgi:uncharacterized protein YbbC (DUF1343 family)
MKRNISTLVRTCTAAICASSIILGGCADASNTGRADKNNAETHHAADERTLEPELATGAERTELYMPLLRGKRCAIVANQSSLVGNRHLVDTLLAMGADLRRIFSPEHGFRGTADAGEKVSSYSDKATGLEIVSLYGANFKPTQQQLADIDILIYDLQDVGARFYTYFATMSYAMEACAEAGTEFLVLDRPNPNGQYIDGPLLDAAHISFVGLHPGVPIVHAMTSAEYARMANAEGWLAGGQQCKLSWVPCLGYNRAAGYDLPVRPSPNLPNALSVQWYPTLALYEGTVLSLGRGTDFPFQALGHPSIEGSFCFTPESRQGAAKKPPLLGMECCGIDLRNSSAFSPGAEINIELLLYTYSIFPDKKAYFNNFFAKLAGTSLLREQIASGKTASEIRESWNAGLQQFQNIRAGYLIYPDSPLITGKYGSGAHIAE